jgi:exodeoxyribonuclease V beta subunit
MAAEPLDALTLPLRGSCLIEASAGTGKTWTIAALYLRLVLGHGGESAYLRPLGPAEILVMTFTRAATRELADRIRTRLLQAARCFRGDEQPDAQDGFLSALLAAYPEGPARQTGAWRLATAAEGMDEAAVHTIDAWCQRMLREHAFDSGSLFDEVLTTDERVLQDEAARDYWRQQLYPLTGPALDAALAVWPGVQALADDARHLLAHELPPGAGRGSLGELVERLRVERAQHFAALKAGWAGRARQMKAWLDGQLAAAACPFDRKRLQPRHYTPWLAELEVWAGQPQPERPDLKKGAERLTPAGLQEALRPGGAVELPPMFAAFAQLMQALDRLPGWGPPLRLHAAARNAVRLAELKAQAGSYGFADLLARLDGALDPAVHGEHATRLRERILAQYPVALIDEFQDTSPVQARIFDRLYRIADDAAGTALLLIGDPKQSIYGFRGADIHSYLQARRAAAGRHYALDTNHRSTAALVAAVDHLYRQAEARPGAGAFLYRAAAASADEADPLPYRPVRARGRAERFATSAGQGTALTLELDAELLDAGSSRRQFAARCAERIVTLLNDRGAGFEQPGAGFARLRPADIAVLVRTGIEAAAVRRELRRRTVASVYLSDRDSVFDSAEASDLLRWLQAVAAPLDARLARAALATRTVGLSIEELTRLASDEEAFEARCGQLRQLHATWRGQGVLAMLRQTLHLLDLPARWLAGPDADGERRLTNVLHLAELLQAASARHGGEQALIRWLASQRDGGSATGDEQILRLESDADLVKIVTVHKAKGLEYPLVFLPFPCSYRGMTRARARFVTPADADGRRTLLFEPGDAELAAADLERQREDLRLLYVALTRARHAVWVGLAALKLGSATACVWHRSAIGTLLGGAEPVAPVALPGRIRALVQSCAGIELREAEAPDEIGRTLLRPRDEPAPLREPVPYTADFERRWTVASYSALVRDLAASAGAWAESAAAARDDEAPAPGEAVPADALADLAGPARAAVEPWHAFPRGALAGNFLHDQLEWLAGEGFAHTARPELQQELLRRCARQGYGEHGAQVAAWLAQVVRSPLPPLGAALAEIGSPVPELEFWFPSDGLTAGAVDSLCRRHLLDGCARPALPERELRGMLMGFADLVFEHGGRYWVLDYKSNHLGPGDGDYGPAALQAAMAGHRYDVQAALYLLALHRLLRARLGAAYEPARQLGGAVYLFLRGIRGPAAGCCWVPPRLELLAALDRLLERHAEPAR